MKGNRKHRRDPRKRGPGRAAGVLACLAATGLAGTPVFGAPKAWDGGGTTSNWSDASNWSPDGVPGPGDAVRIDNGSVNPVPQINAQSGGACATITVDGAVAATFLNYGGSTPLVTRLYGNSADPAGTGPLLRLTENAPASVSANKVNFQLRVSGEWFVAAGKTFTLSNSLISQNGVRSLTKTGAGTIRFSGSGSEVSFTGGLNVAEGVWNASADTLDLPTSGIVAFTNGSGVRAVITSTNSHRIEGLAGGNSDSEFSVTGAEGVTVTGALTTVFGGRLAGATRLTHSGSGRLTLTGANTCTGPTRISSGTLALGPGGSLSESASIEVADGAVFDVSASSGGYVAGSGKIVSGAGSIVGKLTAATGSTVAPTGTLSVSGGFELAGGARLKLSIRGAADHDAIEVTGEEVTLAGVLDGTLGYAPVTGDTIYLVRNEGTGSTTGTLSGVGDGGKIDIGGRWFRVSFTSDADGSGFAVGGTGNDVAVQAIDDPAPSGASVRLTGDANGAVVGVELSWIDNSPDEDGYLVYRVLDDGTLELVATLPANTTSFSETVSNYTLHTYAVRALGGSGPVGDVSFSPPFQAGTSFAERQAAMLDYLSSTVPNLGQFGGGPHRIGRTGFWCATGRILRGDTGTGISYITTALEDANAEGANAGFSMWPGMDAYLRWQHLFPQTLRDRYREIYVGADAYDNGSTPNQRFMLATASYLANGVWGSGVNSVSSAANGIGDRSGKGFILHLLEKTPFLNHEEHNSPQYLQYTLAAIETLAQFAHDEEVRTKARLVIDWSLAEAAGYMHNGRWCVSATRGRASQQQNDYSITGWTWYLLFGGPAPASYFDSFATAPFLAPQFPEMPAEVLAAARSRTRSFTRRSVAQRYLGGGDVAYFKQCWMTPGYALWSQTEGDVAYHADGSMDLLDMDTAGIQDGYQGNRWGLAWDAPPSTDSVLTLTSPTTYRGSTGGISVWEDTLQHRDTMIAVYNMPPGGGGSTGNNGNWANEFLRGHIPGGYQAVIDETAGSGRLFLHYRNVLVALFLSRPFSWATDFTVNDVNRAALAIETAPVDEFPGATAASRLAAFRDAVLVATPDTTGVSGESPRFRYINRHGDLLDLTFGLAGKINGVTVDYRSWPVLEDPWMRQAQNGHLHLFGANQRTTLDFHGWKRHRNTRPVLLRGERIVVVAGSHADVDLSARVGDPGPDSAGLAFLAGNASGGSVAMTPGAAVARFTPSAGAGSEGSFAFSARDRDIHPQLVWHYDFESSMTSDASGQGRDATLAFAGAGSAMLSDDVPSALGAGSRGSLRLLESTPDAARLQRSVTRANLEMSNGSWTFSTWFKRARRNSEDFIFYLGGGDGFGGGGEELHLYAQNGVDVLRLLHYNASNVQDANLATPSVVVPDLWHHVAVVFEKTSDQTGTLRLYLNGALSSSAEGVALALPQVSRPVILGGHPFGTSAVNRYLDGWLDDAALFRGALTPGEIEVVALQGVAAAGGLAVEGTVALDIVSPREGWRQRYFSTLLGTGPAGDLFDADGDGELNLFEFATAQNPLAATLATPLLITGSGGLRFDYTRSTEASRDGVVYRVEWSDSLEAGEWSEEGVTSEILEDGPEIQRIRAFVPGGVARRFVRLRVVR